MAFDVAATAYGRFMGRFSEPLGPLFADAAGVRAGQRALDVGCGPGALTAPLVERLGADQVVAVDPAAGFVEATRRRFPGVEVAVAPAESLSYADDTFDVVLAQLVVHFMRDPGAGVREMTRVCRPGGTVGAAVWDLTTGHGPLAAYWQAVHELNPAADDERRLPGGREGELLELLDSAGLGDLVPSTLEVTVPFATFEEWWEPYLLGVGPAGDYVKALDEDGRTRLRERCRELLPEAPFEIRARAWCAVGTAPSP